VGDEGKPKVFPWQTVNVGEPDENEKTAARLKPRRRTSTEPLTTDEMGKWLAEDRELHGRRQTQE